jgi:microcystin-dependent protein
MTQVVLPYRPVAGDPEDISQILADFDAILNVLNGQLKDDNFAADMRLAVNKMAAGANRQVLETVGTSVVWGDRGVPTGVIMPYLGPGAPPPTGWLFCDGALVPRNQYPDLLGVIGNQYGAGDANNFALPNIKGRVVVGADGNQAEFNAIGKIGGENYHKLVNGEMPVHNHGVNTTNDTPAHRHYLGYNLILTGNAGAQHDYRHHK